MSQEQFAKWDSCTSASLARRGAAVSGAIVPLARKEKAEAPRRPKKEKAAAAAAAAAVEVDDLFSEVY